MTTLAGLAQASVTERFEGFAQQVLEQLESIDRRLGGLEERITRLEASEDNTASAADAVATRSLRSSQTLTASAGAYEEDDLNGYVRGYLDNFMDHIRVADYSMALGELLIVVDSVGTDRGHHSLSERNLEKLQECHQAFAEGMNGQSPDQDEQALIDEMIMKGMNHIVSFADDMDAQDAIVTLATVLKPWIATPEAATSATGSRATREELLGAFKGIEGAKSLAGLAKAYVKNEEKIKVVEKEEAKVRQVLPQIEDALDRLDIGTAEALVNSLDLHHIEDQTLGGNLRDVVGKVLATKRSLDQALALLGDATDALAASDFARAAQLAEQAEALNVQDPSILASIEEVKQKAAAEIRVEAEQAEALRSAQAELKQLQQEVEDLQHLKTNPEDLLRKYLESDLPGIKVRAGQLSSLLLSLQEEEKAGQLLFEAREKLDAGELTEAEQILDQVGEMNLKAGQAKIYESAKGRLAAKQAGKSSPTKDAPAAVAAVAASPLEGKVTPVRAESAPASVAAAVREALPEPTNLAPQPPQGQVPLYVEVPELFDAVNDGDSAVAATPAESTASAAASSNSASEGPKAEAFSVAPSDANDDAEEVSHGEGSRSRSSSSGASSDANDDVQGITDQELTRKISEIHRQLNPVHRRKAEAAILQLLAMNLPEAQARKVDGIKGEYNAKFMMNQI